jgi:hypothetical protein
MQAIKSLVVFMGILIVAGIGLLGYGMYTKSRSLGSESAAAAPSAPLSGLTPSAPVASGTPGRPPAPGQIAAPGPVVAVGGGVVLPAFDMLSLGEPKGTVARTFQVSGSTLVIELAGGGKPPRLAVVDLSRGSVLGTVQLSDDP